MAKEVGYFKDFKTEEEAREAFSEGPFVMVEANGYRVEVERPGGPCPVLTDVSTDWYLNRLGHYISKGPSDLAARAVDLLNAAVRVGLIVLKGDTWKYVGHPGVFEVRSEPKWYFDEVTHTCSCRERYPSREEALDCYLQDHPWKRLREIYQYRD